MLLSLVVSIWIWWSGYRKFLELAKLCWVVFLKHSPGEKGLIKFAARLGVLVILIGCVGCDAFGQEMHNTLIKEGIDITHILVHAESANGVALIQVDVKGQNSIAVASGANFHLTSAHLENALQSIENFDVLVMPLENSLETIYSAAKNTSLRGVKVIEPGSRSSVNPEPARTGGYLNSQ